MIVLLNFVTKTKHKKNNKVYMLKDQNRVKVLQCQKSIQNNKTYVYIFRYKQLLKFCLKSIT